MSDINSARRADVQINFKGSERRITLNKDWMSFTYTDNEEDEADDFQLKTHDREGKWLRDWLAGFVQDQANSGEIISTAEQAQTASGTVSGGSSSGSKGSTAHNVYKVTSPNGLNIRSGAGEKYKILGKYAYGDYIEVKSFSNGWANVSYAGKNAYVKGANLVLAGTATTSSGSSSGSTTYSTGTSGSSSGWTIGEAVVCTGRPQYTSYGEGNPGVMVTNHKGKVTYLNLKAGVPYPICVDYLGWFAENQVTKASESVPKPSNGTNTAINKGTKISASIVLKNANNDGKDEVLDCGLFELDSIDMQGPPSTLTIKGTSLSYSSTIRQTLKSKSWENITLSAIAKEIANANGMSTLFESANNPKYSRVEQYKMSDIAFLQKLCHDAGCSLKATNNIIVIFDQAEYESKTAVKTIRFGAEGGYTKYKLSTKENSCYTSCRVYCTTSSGAVISATEYASNYREGSDGQQCLEVNQKVSSIAEAQQLAHKYLRLHNKFETQATFTFPGNPALVAGSTMVLENFGMWDGVYIIRQAKHTVSSSGYTTEVTLRKALAGNEKIASASVSEDDDAAIQELAMQCIRGDWGNGQDREDRLTAAGHDYHTVQARVDKILYG